MNRIRLSPAELYELSTIMVEYHELNNNLNKLRSGKKNIFLKRGNEGILVLNGSIHLWIESLESELKVVISKIAKFGINVDSTVATL